jgi:protoporphyrinogen oxidase
MVSLYDKSRVTISSTTPGVTFDGQVTIDSTGKAKDTLKRIKVTIPTHTANSMVNYGIEAQSACKRITSQGFSLAATLVGC